MESDPFDELLRLEDQFYDEGYQLGAADGAKAGRIEGRIFGLEKGFEKYAECGKLHGRSLVWLNRLPNAPKTRTENGPGEDIVKDVMVAELDSASPRGTGQVQSRLHLPSLPKNTRLQKHINVLYALAEPASLPTENTEEAVSDFDDRFKRAAGKIKIIEKLIGEEASVTSGSVDAPGSSSNTKATNGDSIEDINVSKIRR